MTAPARRILLCEDDANDVTLTLTALQGKFDSLSIDVVSDGSQALDYLYRRGAYQERMDGAPDVILLDLKMPRVDGLEVLRQIKSDEQLQVIPVVILTSSRQDRDLDKAYQLGANSYIVKPVNFGDFKEALEQFGLIWGRYNSPPPSS